MLQFTLQRYRSAYGGLPREAWLLAIVMFVNRAGTMVLPFMTLYLTSQLGMSEALAGRLLSVYGLGAVCGAYAGGRLAARWGAIRVQTTCMLLTVPGFALLPWAQSWQAMAALLFGLSLVNEAVRPANAAAVTQFTSPEKRMRAFALQRLAGNLGFSCGPALGGVLAEIDFGLLFAVDALTSLAAAVALATFFPWRRVGGAAEVDRESAIHVSPLRDGPFVAFLLLMLLSMMVFNQFGSTYPLFLRDHFGMDKPSIGLMFAVNTTVIVLVEMLLLDAIKHWPVVRTIGWGCFLSCVGWGVLPFGTTTAFAVAAMLIVTVGEMLSFAMSAGFVANRSRAGGESAYLGWYMVMFATASVIGPGVGGALYQRDPNAVWYAALGVGAAVLVGFLLLAARLRESGAAAANERTNDGYGEAAAGGPLLGLPESA